MLEEPCISNNLHYSWLSWSIDGQDPQAREFEWVGECHQFVLVKRGSWTKRWTQGGRDIHFTSDPGDVDFYAADGEPHTVRAVPKSPYDVFFLAVPRRHLTDLAAADGLDKSVEFRTRLMIDDARLQRSLSAIAAATAAGEPCEEPARELVIRISELVGGFTPAWRCDSSVFPKRVMGDLTDFIDAHLRLPIGLSEIATTVGLSPSHFAKKFRVSSGLSLQRFANLRRTRQAIGCLQAGSENMAALALELGFYSQSHMNRVFRDHIGLSPGRYRRQYKRTIG
jgi:AraC-like DNA-binding protein